MVNSNLAKKKDVTPIPRTVSKAGNLYFLELFVILFFFAYYLLPAVNSAVSFMAALILAIAYTVYIFIREPEWRATLAGFLLVALSISFLFYFLTETKTISIDVSNYALKRIASKMYQYVMMFFPACLFVRIYTKASTTQKKILYWAAVIMFSIVVVNTFVELMTNETASRDWTEFSTQSENNIGTYSFVYLVPMLVTALVSLLYTQKGFKKLLVVGVIAFLFIFLLSAQYTLAILISVIGMALQLSANIKTSAGKALLWMLFIGLLFLLPSTLELLAESIESEQISIRFKELAAFFGGGDASGYNLNGRFELYWKSIEAFLKSPIIGNRQLSFDGHATLLTVPADIGIFGLFGIWILLFKSKKYVSAAMGERSRLFNPVFVCLIIMGFTNPIHSAITALFGTWMLAPMIIKTGEENEK